MKSYSSGKENFFLSVRLLNPGSERESEDENL
jgi:hypothetical protein